MANHLRFPQRFALICRLWGIQPSSKAMRAALSADPTVLNRWANFNTQKNDTKSHPDEELIPAFVKHLEETRELHRRGYVAVDIGIALTKYDDKKFLQFLVARSLPTSVRELTQVKFDHVKSVLLGNNPTARYFMYRLGVFEQEDLNSFPDPAGRRLLQASARLLRRVPPKKRFACRNPIAVTQHEQSAVE